MRKLDLAEFDRAGFARQYGPWAVIAGASEGTGSAYAEQLAALGINLVLVSRRQEALDSLGNRLAEEHGVAFRSVVADLRSADAAAAILEACADIEVGLYVSNAGTDGAGNGFLDSPVARSLDLLAMNAGTLLQAIHGFGQAMKQRARGGIIIMSSGAGLGGQPWLAMYSATKAFELNLAESLWAELGDQGIDVLAVVAPGMNTPSLRRAVAGTSFDVDQTYDPDEVVHLALDSLGKEPAVIIPDGPNEELIPAIQAARKVRLIALAEWAKSYTSGATA